ncbi:hypothetical protein E8E13_009879 [Curvularia kusanoi]|uniref:Uncharacterized protein n=1 Tax=Curvularia kusanoi TaxID=90978 RepID=A0A9P4TF54_CURKU|nr:hypothetical protein E8E13_009879 [Curvularia kusanoi]
MPQAEKLHYPANPPARPSNPAASQPQTLAPQVSPATEAITWLSLLVYWLLSLQPLSEPSGEKFSPVPFASPSTVQSGIVSPINAVLSSSTVTQTFPRPIFTIVTPTPTSSFPVAETPQPTDLLSALPITDLTVFEKRLAIDLDAWTSVWAIWIRSWYGDDIEGAAGAGVTQAQSDEAYARLKQKAFCSLEIEGKIDEEVAASCIFDDDWFEWGLTLMDASDSDMEVMDDVPSIVYSALMRCPDALDRIGEETQRHWYAASDAERDLDQALVVLVADGIACEEERVLMASLNHKGQLLCTPQRCGVRNLGLSMTSWRHRRGSR